MTLGPRPTPAALVLVAATVTVAHTAPVASLELGEYWYRGEAEVTSYLLEQARYGEVHPGEAVMIFVTEDFSRSRHVKLERGGGVDSVPVLKLNMTRKFSTGLYPYSMMTSVFTPVDDSTGWPLKVTTSSQEWCGHTFTQLNRSGAGYLLHEYSYFESEGDRRQEIAEALPEDGLWSMLRIDPGSLPTGEVLLIPGTVFQRLRHTGGAPARAVAELVDSPDDPELRSYRLRYPELERTLEVNFRREAPYAIESWEESYTSGWGPGATRLTTRAQRKKRLLLDYWNRNALADAGLRAELGLE